MISIIMPYYKKKKFVLEAINSVLKQTYKKFELLIVYDDECRDEIYFINKIKSKDKRIKLIINKNAKQIFRKFKYKNFNNFFIYFFF